MGQTMSFLPTHDSEWFFDITYKNGDIEDCLWPIWLCFSHITRSMVTACANFNSDLPTCPSTFGCLRTPVNRRIRHDKHQGDGRQDLPSSKHNFFRHSE